MTNSKDTVSILPDRQTCYAALCARDTRFDGRIFVGVSSTGIYCRPICRVKQPREENCSFYVSAAAAEAAGYRPCLKCRPELAPGISAVDAASYIARKAAILMEEEDQEILKIADLAETLGISDRHLRRVFTAEFGVSPVQYLKTRKLLSAKSLLTDTRLSITEIALATGFGSVRRFNELFKKHYGFPPGRLRGMVKALPKSSGTITLLLGYRPPYAWNRLMAFLAARAIPGVESVAGQAYRRTVCIRKGKAVYRGWVEIMNKPDRNSVSITLTDSLLPILSRVLTKIRHLFDLDCNPQEIYEKLTVMNTLSEGLCIPGIRLPGCFDAFEMSVRAVLGQQVTVKAARTLSKRLAETFGEKIETPFPELNCTFPEPIDICRLGTSIENHLGPLGITGARARSIMALAEAVTKVTIRFSYSADPEKEMKELLQLPGFGPWTVQYIGMRVLGWPDAFPHTDYGVKKALAGMLPDEILKLSQAWRPWRSYSAILLWDSLNTDENNLKEIQKP